MLFHWKKACITGHTADWRSLGSNQRHCLFCYRKVRFFWTFHIFFCKVSFSTELTFYRSFLKERSARLFDVWPVFFVTVSSQVNFFTKLCTVSFLLRDFHFSFSLKIFLFVPPCFSAFTFSITLFSVWELQTKQPDKFLAAQK